VARWLAEIDRDQFFLRYCEPPLTSEQRQIVEREGWIFGVC
jgi:hypothetical protein